MLTVDSLYLDCVRLFCCTRANYVCRLIGLIDSTQIIEHFKYIANANDQ